MFLTMAGKSNVILLMSDKQYYHIKISSLLPDENLPFELYIHLNNKYTLYCREGASISAAKLEKFLLKDDMDQHFFIKIEDKKKYQAFIQSFLNSGKLKTEDKARILRQSTIPILEDLFTKADIGESVAESQKLVGTYMEFMDEGEDAMASLLGLSSHDFYTYNHSLDVSIYAMGLGAKVGISGEDLAQLSTGALFHDIGKRQVSLDILCKSGPLDDDEWIQMQKHPQYGLIILNEQDNISNEVKACCFEHHESCIGNGYPQQLTSNEIHPYAKIIAICDTFDAMTTQRSYNKPMTPKDALYLMGTKFKERYSPEFLEAFCAVIKE